MSDTVTIGNPGVSKTDSPSQAWRSDAVAAPPPPGQSIAPPAERPNWLRRFGREATVHRRLGGLLETAKVVQAAPESRFVILSDLHLGDGGRGDDFRRNADLVLHAMRHYYLRRDFHLVLNGDIEDELKFRPSAIRRAWPEFFDLTSRSTRAGRLLRVAGNHDYDPAPAGEPPRHRSVVLSLHGGLRMLVFHGHQASNVGMGLAYASRAALRWAMRALRVPNYTISHSNPKRIVYERRVYDFAREHGLLAVIGHTHRPLFESLPKTDSLKYQIERLCREYAAAAVEEKGALRTRIRLLHDELREALQRKAGEGTHASIYDSDVVVPCLFNSGCAIGKRGFTAIEVRDDRISLVHWSREGVMSPTAQGIEQERLGNGPYVRTVLRRECLRYIFARVRLLAP